VIGKQDTYFVRHRSGNPHKYSEADIKGTLEQGILVYNIYVVFEDQVFQQFVGIPMDTNLFLFSYEAEFVQKLLQDKNENNKQPKKKTKKKTKKISRVLQPCIKINQSAIIIFTIMPV
jgi:hypothetical protein